jgi:hypothetical protein
VELLMTSEFGLRTSQVTGTVAFTAAHGGAPSGTEPSLTVTVTVTWPWVVHVKLVFAEFGAEKVPLDADHVYVRALAFGAATGAAVRATVPPSPVSDGLAEMEPWKMLAHE